MISIQRLTAIPLSPPPYLARGQCLTQVNKLDSALEDFNAALNINNRNADAWAGLGLVHEKMNNKAKAIEAYNTAIGIDANQAIARAGLNRLR